MFAIHPAVVSWSMKRWRFRPTPNTSSVTVTPLSGTNGPPTEKSHILPATVEIDQIEATSTRVPVSSVEVDWAESSGDPSRFCLSPVRRWADGGGTTKPEGRGEFQTKGGKDVADTRLQRSIRLGDHRAFSTEGASGALSVLASVPYFLIGVTQAAWAWVERKVPFLDNLFSRRPPYREVPIDDDGESLSVSRLPNSFR